MKVIALLVWAELAKGQSTPPDPAAAVKLSMEKQRAAIAVQRQAAAKQAAFAAQYRLSAPVSITAAETGNAADAPDCAALPDTALDPLLESASKRQGVAVNVLRAVARQESGFRPCAVSPKGAKGLMQLMPATAEELSVRNPFDPEENMQAGARYLKDLLTRYQGDLKLALAAYNAGPKNVTTAGGVPNIQETRDYVETILRAVGQSSEATRSPPPVLSAIPPIPPVR